MVEGNRYIEQYARMTPRERNVELSLLYEQLPAKVAFIQILDPDIPDELKWPERTVSEHKQVIMSCLGELLKYSALTAMGKTIFQEEFASRYDTGVDKHIPDATDEDIRTLAEKGNLDSEETEDYRAIVEMMQRKGKESAERDIFLVLFDNLESGGIFDRERAPVLERQFYEWYKDHYSILRRTYMKVAVQDASDMRGDRRAGEMAREEYQKLEKWEEQLGVLAEDETGES